MLFNHNLIMNKVKIVVKATLIEGHTKQANHKDRATTTSTGVTISQQFSLKE